MTEMNKSGSDNSESEQSVQKKTYTEECFMKRIVEFYLKIGQNPENIMTDYEKVLHYNETPGGNEVLYFDNGIDKGIIDIETGGCMYDSPECRLDGFEEIAKLLDEFKSDNKFDENDPDEYLAQFK
ncbi:MAG: hypothetical protein PHX08_01580 [Lachnospiraceae bacterium]|nr:hypothetical protein [Lachnospiraceae bacterium]